MYCPKCGKQMPAGAAFCPEDGAKLPVMRAVPGKEIPDMSPPSKLPYYKGFQSEYRAAPAKTSSTTNYIIAVIIVSALVFAIVTIINNQGGTNSCPITPTCGERGLGAPVPPGCKCPGACSRYTIIHNPPSMEGWKQCQR